MQLIPEEIAWAPRKQLPGTATEVPAQLWAQPRKGCRARKQPGRNSWRSLFSLQEERLNKKLEKGGNKALSVPHAARRNSWAGIAAEIWHQSEFWRRREQLAWGSVMTEAWENRPDRRLPGTGTAPALPSSPGAFVTKAIFPRVTKLQCRSIRGQPFVQPCTSLPAHKGGPQALAPQQSRAGPLSRQQGRGCRAAAASPLLPLLRSNPHDHPEQLGGVRAPHPCPEGLSAPRGEQLYFKAVFNKSLLQL